MIDTAVIPAEAGVFQPAVDGSVLVDWKLLRENLKAKSLVDLARMFLDTGAILDGVMDEVRSAAIVKAALSNQTLIQLGDGREVEVKPGWSKYDVAARKPEAMEKLEEAQRAFDDANVDVFVHSRTKRLTLDDDVMKALGLTDQDLVKVADSVSVDVMVPDVKKLKKAAKLGGLGGSLVEQALTKSEGGLTLKAVKGTAKRASAERLEEAREVPSAEDFDHA